MRGLVDRRLAPAAHVGAGRDDQVRVGAAAGLVDVQVEGGRFRGVVTAPAGGVGPGPVERAGADLGLGHPRRRGHVGAERDVPVHHLGPGLLGGSFGGPGLLPCRADPAAASGEEQDRLELLIEGLQAVLAVPAEDRVSQAPGERAQRPGQGPEGPRLPPPALPFARVQDGGGVFEHPVGQPVHGRAAEVVVGLGAGPGHQGEQEPLRRQVLEEEESVPDRLAVAAQHRFGADRVGVQLVQQPLLAVALEHGQEVHAVGGEQPGCGEDPVDRLGVDLDAGQSADAFDEQDRVVGQQLLTAGVDARLHGHRPAGGPVPGGGAAAGHASAAPGRDVGAAGRRWAAGHRDLRDGVGANGEQVLRCQRSMASGG